MKRSASATGVFLLLAIVGRSAAALSSLEECKTLRIDLERLACYDRVSGREPPAADAPADTKAPAQSGEPIPSPSPSLARPVSRMTRHWELDPASKSGLFNFRPHHENYIVATYNRHPNEVPYRPFRQLNPGVNLANGELAFQVGFKLKLAENPAQLPMDVWFGYTQRSFWQAGNREASSPFRESNYEPEVMAVVPVDMNLAGLRLRFMNLGVVHQSNGGGSALSRSWNRIYLQAGMERGDFQLLARLWKRIDEAVDEDDNPGITTYMGRGDLTGTYRWRGNEFSLMTRYNFTTDKGAAQLGWSFPLNSRLKGYVQYFSGYGYSLIDHDAYQRIIGLGVLVTY